MWRTLWLFLRKLAGAILCFLHYFIAFVIKFCLEIYVLFPPLSVLFVYKVGSSQEYKSVLCFFSPHPHQSHELVLHMKWFLLEPSTPHALKESSFLEIELLFLFHTHLILLQQDFQWFHLCI